MSPESRWAPSCSKTPCAWLEMVLGDGARAGLRDEAAEREMAQGGLVAFAQQIEQRGALREVVVRVGGAAALGVQAAAQPEVFAPRRRRGFRIERVGHRREALFGLGQAAGERQRLGGDERRLQRIERRRARLKDLVGQRDGFIEGAPAQREPRAQHADRPLVPLARLPSVRAICLAGLREKVGRLLVVAADHVDLGERVEHGARRLVELNRAAQLERAVQDVVGPVEIAEAHADLAEVAERDGEPVPRSVRLLERDAALGERERLLVAVLHHHDGGLVPADRRQDVVGVDERRRVARPAEARPSPRRYSPTCASRMLEREWTSAR